MMDADVEVRCNAGYGFAERCDQGWRARSQPWHAPERGQV